MPRRDRDLDRTARHRLVALTQPRSPGATGSSASPPGADAAGQPVLEHDAQEPGWSARASVPTSASPGWVPTGGVSTGGVPTGGPGRPLEPHDAVDDRTRRSSGRPAAGIAAPTVQGVGPRGGQAVRPVPAGSGAASRTSDSVVEPGVPDWVGALLEPSQPPATPWPALVLPPRDRAWARLDHPDRRARGVTDPSTPALPPSDGVGATGVGAAPATDPPAAATVPVSRSAAALGVAAAGYVAAHGDPLARGPVRRRRVRWAVPWRLAGAAGAVVLLVAGAVALRAASLAPGPAVTLPTPAPTGPVSTTEPAATEVVVDVVGAVATPGVVRLAAGSRVVDAITAAGGATPDAQLSALNLARLLVDGEQIAVPRAGEPPAAAAPAGTVQDGVVQDGAAQDGLVDLNAATAADLDALPGIGPVLADRIVAHREERPFTTVDELADVAGIGPTLLERLRALVRV